MPRAYQGDILSLRQIVVGHEVRVFTPAMLRTEDTHRAVLGRVGHLTHPLFGAGSQLGRATARRKGMYEASITAGALYHAFPFCENWRTYVARSGARRDEFRVGHRVDGIWGNEAMAHKPNHHLILSQAVELRGPVETGGLLPNDFLLTFPS